MKKVTVTVTAAVTLTIPDGFEGKCTPEDLHEMAADAVCHHHDQSVQLISQSICQFDPPESDKPNDAIFVKAWVEVEPEDEDEQPRGQNPRWQ